MDSNLLDLAVGAPAAPYPNGPKALAATARDVALVLSPKGWTVGRDTAHSWLFTDAFGRKARLWRDSFDVWRLSAAPPSCPRRHQACFPLIRNLSALGRTFHLNRAQGPFFIRRPPCTPSPFAA